MTDYSEIENIIVQWVCDGDKTAGHLTRQIMQKLESFPTDDAKDVVKAWSALPKGYYDNRTIQNWLVNDMKPAIDKLGAKLNSENNIEDDQFLEKLKGLSEDKDAAIDLVYKHFGDLIIEKEFSRCNAILDKIQSENFDAWLLLPFLTLTIPYKTLLTNRSVVFASAIGQLSDTLSSDQLTATIKRLK